MNEFLHMNEGVVDLPPGFRDLSVQALEWRHTDGTAISLTVQRETLPADSDLDGYVRQSIGEYYRELPGFRIDSRRVAEGAAAPSVLLSYRWHGDAGLVAQAQGFAQIGRKLLLFTVTTAGSARQEAEQIVEHALKHFRLRDRAGVET